MSQKTSPPKKPKKKGTGKKSRFAFQLTRKELFLWLGVAFLAMVWMFTLGVIVGRGMSPVRFDVEKLKKELLALKEDALTGEEGANKPGVNATPDKRHLDFYDVLTDKKQEARLKSLPKAPPPAKKEIARRPESKKQQKASEASKQKPKASSAIGETPVKSFTLQVASLRDSARARKLVSDLKSKGYGAYAVTARVNGKGTYHRVRVGHFKDLNEARTMATRLRHEKFEPIVIRE